MVKKEDNQYSNIREIIEHIGKDYTLFILRIKK